jgi:hypothetical protein
MENLNIRPSWGGGGGQRDASDLNHDRTTIIAISKIDQPKQYGSPHVVIGLGSGGWVSFI